MTIIPIIINGKFLMIAAPKKQIKNSKHISAKIRMNQSFAFIFVDLFCSRIAFGTDKTIAHTIR